MSTAKLLCKLVRHPFVTIRSINRDSLRLAWGYLKCGDFKGFAGGMAYFVGRTSVGTAFKPELIYGSLAPETHVELPPCEAPLVSIIIPVHNQWAHTHACLATVAKNSGDVPYEVIIADDCSTDRTLDIETLVTNIRVVRTPTNLGFLRNCNNAARGARGKYLLFLNNDTNVQPDWLAPLVSVMEENPRAGVVGSKLVYPDGMLQEAGGIIWSDASGWNFGWRDDPEKSEYSYLKEADFVSGASLMVRRELWEAAKGFDEEFVPAYYEDTDLCFRARKLGWKVFCQPLSTVVHFEGISHGRTLASGIKKHQVVNRERFSERWRDTLAREHFPNGESVFRARDRSRGKPAVLVIDQYVPTYDRDAGSFFMYSLLSALAALGYKVVFWPANLYRHEPYSTELQQLGVEVLYGRRRLSNYLAENAGCFDAALLTRNHVAVKVIDTVRKAVPRVLYFDPDLEFLREGRRMALEGEKPRALARVKERELSLFRRCDLVGIHSPVEKEIIQREVPGARVEVVPLPVREAFSTETSFAGREGLLFVGGNHPPNADGLVWFIREILPFLRKSLPGISLTVVGNLPKDRLRGLDTRDVDFAGYVPDLGPCHERARVFVAPLRYGAGIKGKVLEAMNAGVAVVTTEVGAEGIGLTNGENVLIADTPEAFAEAVARLHNDERLWETIRRNGREHVEANFSQEIFRARVEAVLKELLA